MPLVTSTEMFKKAYDGGYAIGAFNVNNMEIVQGITEAARDLEAPLILQVSKGARAYANRTYLMKLVEAAVIDTGLPICLHLDHGDTFELCKSCIDDGFTSVMIDGSKLSFEDNIAVTQEVVRIANAAGASVEAELGAILGSEDNISHDDSKPFLVRVQDVIDFTAAVKVDALAVGIGNAHGLYKGRPNLDFQRLQEVRDVTDVPLVLHGGSGIPDDMIQTAIEIGIRKINVATEIRMAYVEGLLSGSANGDYYEMVKAGKASVKAPPKSKIDMFLLK